MSQDQNKPHLSESISTYEFDKLLHAVCVATRNAGDTDAKGKITALKRYINTWKDACCAKAVAETLEAAAAKCEEISSDFFDQYKGRGRHAPNNPHRADTYCNGMSDGAGACAIEIGLMIEAPKEQAPVSGAQLAYQQMTPTEKAEHDALVAKLDGMITEKIDRERRKNVVTIDFSDRRIADRRRTTRD